MHVSLAETTPASPFQNLKYPAGGILLIEDNSKSEMVPPKIEK